MTATLTKVIVSLYHDSQELAWEELTLAEAKERLEKTMAPRHQYRLPLWQFDDDGSTPESVRQDRCNAAYKAIRES